jgi:hypothetical protein
MAEVIHHEDSGSNALMIVIIILVIVVGGVLLWKYLPAGRDTNSNQPGVNLNINNPPGDNTGGSNNGGVLNY